MSEQNLKKSKWLIITPNTFYGPWNFAFHIKDRKRFESKSLTLPKIED